jgi:hypothetical protein
MSKTLPTLFRNAEGYSRRMTLTSKGVVVTEVATDSRITRTIREHAGEVTGFVCEGMPAMRRG